MLLKWLGTKIDLRAGIMKWYKASFVLCMDISSMLKKQLDNSGPETTDTKIKISPHIFMVLGRFVHGTRFDLIKLFWHKFTLAFL
jgi:hypothetical protein